MHTFLRRAFFAAALCTSLPAFTADIAGVLRMPARPTRTLPKPLAAAMRTMSWIAGRL